MAKKPPTKSQLDENSLNFTITIVGHLYESPPIKNSKSKFRFTFLDKKCYETTVFQEWKLNESDESGQSKIWTSNPISILNSSDFIKELNDNPIFAVIESNELISGVINNYYYFYFIDVSPLFCDTKLIMTFAQEGYYQTSPIFSSFIVQIELNKAIIPADKLKEYNPLILEVDTITDLPGFNASNSMFDSLSTKDELITFYSENKYNYLNSIQEPMFCLIKCFKFRDVVIPGIIQKNKIKLHFTTIFITKFYDAMKLQKYLQYDNMDIYLIDRFNKIKIPSDLIPANTSNPANTKNKDGLVTDNTADIKIINYIYNIKLNSINSMTHGVSTIKLNTLLSRSDEIRKMFPDSSNNTDYNHQITINSPVLPSRQCVIPREGINREKLSEIEKLLTFPPEYITSGTSIKIHLQLLFCLQPDLDIKSPYPQPIFERTIIILPTNDPTYQQLCTLYHDINANSFSNENINIYSFNGQDLVDIQTDKVDILTGFQLISENLRFIYMEGISDKSMNSIKSLFPRDEKNTPIKKYLYNSSNRFPHRIYTDFNLTLKIIKLKHPLQYILNQTNIYKSELFSKNALFSLHCFPIAIMSDTIEAIQKLNAFPIVDGLLEIETKYGCGITSFDKTGIPTRGTTAIKTLKSPKGTSPTFSQGSPTEAFQYSKRRSYAPLDCTNDTYLKSKLEQKKKVNDFISPNIELSEQYKVEAKQKFQDEQDRLNELPPIYIYSSQRLNVTCKTEKPPITKESHDDKKWRTPQGFIWPTLTTSAEKRNTGRNIDEFRLLELSVPYEDKHTAPIKPLVFKDETKNDFDLKLKTVEPYFGGYMPSHWEGDRLIPSLQKNPDFFNSVFKGIDEKEDLKAVEKAEYQLWFSKLRGKDPVFYPYNPLTRKKYDDILQLPVQAKSLKMVRHCKLLNGKYADLEPPPPTIFPKTTQQKNVMRDLATEDNYHGRDQEGKPIDFVLNITQREKITSTKSPPKAISAGETSNLLWKSVKVN